MAENLSGLSGVGPATVDQFKEAGISDLNDLAQADVEQLVEVGMTESTAQGHIQAASRSTVIVQSGEEVVEEYESRGHVTTGIEAFDDYLGGGWADGFVIGFAGSTGSGKTQLTFQSLVAAVEATGKPAVYIETERNRYQPQRIQQMSSQEDTQSKIHRIKAYDLDQQYAAYGAVRDNFDELSLIAIDSFTAQFRLASDFEDRSTFTERSQVIGKHLKELSEVAEELSVPVVITAQIYANPGAYGKGEIIYGGSLFHHFVTFFLRMKDGKGEIKKASLVNHPGKANQDFEVRIKDEGLDAWLA
jgi:DNA repair protein RAD51/DNA repair protein RadA